MHSIRKPYWLHLLILSIVALVSIAPALAANEKKEDVLLGDYYRIEARLRRNDFGVPLYLESSDNGGRLTADVYGIIDHPFTRFSETLQEPASWCDIALLHPNVKACIFRTNSGGTFLRAYAGLKKSKSLEDTRPFTYRYEVMEKRRGYLHIMLKAPDGPFGTKDQRINVEALPLDERRTLVRFSCAYNYGFALRAAEKVYFSTAGRNKIGFTVKGVDRKGEPIYVNGSRGTIERNAVRCYFALQAFMDSLSYPEESRDIVRINQWYDLTDRHRKQLFEMEKQEYVASKTEEHRNQELLRRRLGKDDRVSSLNPAMAGN